MLVQGVTHERKGCIVHAGGNVHAQHLRAYEATKRHDRHAAARLVRRR